MASEHVVVKDIEDFVDSSLTEDITEDLISMESDDNGLTEEDEDDGTTTDGECDGGSSSASSSTTIGVEFLPLEKSKSPVWNHFEFPARSRKFMQKGKCLRKEVYCKLCKQALSYKGNTTNMIVHLQSRHSAVYSEIADQLKTTGKAKSLFLPKDQPSIVDSFKKLTPLPHSSSRWKALTNSVCYFLAKYLHPMSTVNDQGFLRMLKVFEP